MKRSTISRRSATEQRLDTWLASSAFATRDRVPLFPGADVKLVPSSLDPITLEFRLAWGLDARDGCYAVRAYSENAVGRSEIVQLGSTPECTPAPEPTFTGALIVCVLYFGAASVLVPALGAHLRRRAKAYPPVIDEPLDDSPRPSAPRSNP